MEQFHAGGGVIKGRGQPPRLRGISLITKDEQKRPDSFALSEGKVFNAFKENGIHQMEFIFALDSL